ncbi:hypothetical protein HYS54_05110 [Candidatus Micrarchaeota archaeon]|nr:hypothetical protein [Candidatus Micrarchaeota archaeon]
MTRAGWLLVALSLALFAYGLGWLLFFSLDLADWRPEGYLSAAGAIILGIVAAKASSRLLKQ